MGAAKAIKAHTTTLKGHILEGEKLLGKTRPTATSKLDGNVITVTFAQLCKFTKNH